MSRSMIMTASYISELIQLFLTKVLPCPNWQNNGYAACRSKNWLCSEKCSDDGVTSFHPRTENKRNVGNKGEKR